MAARRSSKGLQRDPGCDANDASGVDSQPPDWEEQEGLLVDLSDDTQFVSSSLSLDFMFPVDDSVNLGSRPSVAPMSLSGRDPFEAGRGDLSSVPSPAFPVIANGSVPAARGADACPVAAGPNINDSGGSEATIASMHGVGGGANSVNRLGERGLLLQDRDPPPLFTSATSPSAVEFPRADHNHRLGDEAYVQITPSTEELHCHKMTHNNPDDKLARNQLIAVIVLCFLFMTGEAIGAVLANSLALFTDVLHLASDLISFIISLLAICLAAKPATSVMSFGYYRAEVLGALFSVFIIWLVSGILCYMAVERIINKHYVDVKPNEMLITATCGVVFNFIMGIVLHSEHCCKSAKSRKTFGHSHGHGHGHSHGNHAGSRLGQERHLEYQPLSQSAVEELDVEDAEAAPQHKNINVRAAFIHVIGDIIQSLGVFVAALIIKFKNDPLYGIADPICTFLFSLLVLITTVVVLRDTLRVIMEGVPRDVKYDAVKADLKSITGVVAVHSLHLWSLTIDRNALAVHLASDESVSCSEVRCAAQSLLYTRYKFFHMTIQVEPYDDAMKNCEECNTPKVSQ